ncbi:RHS repeat domain-containing protein, partial [Thiolapillus sp.]
AGYVTEAVDEAGNATSFGYDGNHNLTSVTYPDGNTTRYLYDAEDRLIRQIDARGNITTFEYDATGQLTRRTYPDGTYERMTYDASGRMTTFTDANGDTTQYEYDGAYRIVRKVFADLTEETYTYTPKGQIATATNSSGTVRYEYDVNDRLATKTNPDGSETSYLYDPNGNVIQIAVRLVGGADRTTRYTYDALNRIDSVIDADGLITTFTYDAIGNLTSESYPNGVVSTYTYDARSRLITLRHEKMAQLLASYAYTVDAVGNRVKVEFMDGSYIAYAYDSRRRLIAERKYDSTGTLGFEQLYEYDSVGNRTRLIDTHGNSIPYFYDSADKLVTAGNVSYGYDANGRLIFRQDAGGDRIYSYTHENELNQVSTENHLVSYGYDAEGNRIRRSVDGIATRFLIDEQNPTGLSQSLVDYDDSNTALQEYVYFTHLLEKKDISGLRVYHHDGQRNVRLLSDENGIITDTYEYDAFGDNFIHTGSTENAYRFAGEYFGDAEQLAFHRARYYDPTTGRFISRDPFEGLLRDPQSLHRYLYANNNPLIYVDPTGKFPSLGEVSVVSTISGGLVSGIISYLGNKRGLALVTDTIIGAAFGAIGGPAGNALGEAFSNSKILIELVKKPQIARFALRFAAALPATVLDFAEDLSKGLFNGDAYNSQFYVDLFKGAFLNLVFNMVLGPHSVEKGKYIEFLEAIGPTGIKVGDGIYEIFSNPKVIRIPISREVLHYTKEESDEALDLLSKFCWEFAKLMSTELPKYFGRN